MKLSLRQRSIPHSTSREADKSVRLTEGGGILLVTLVVCSMVGLMLACYLKMVGGQHTYTFRSQVWNAAIPVCEAGIEEAMAHLNYHGTTNNFAVNGWTLDSGLYKRERTVPDGRYSVSIDTNFPPIVTCHGQVPVPLQTDRWMTRSVRVRTRWNRRFPQGVLMKGAIDLGGTSALIDSYNSTNSLYSTNGRYDPAKANDQATIASLATIPGQFDINNTKIHGRIGLSPGGTVIAGPNGAVGEDTWVASNTGVQAGHQQNDLNIYVENVVLPTDYGPVFTPSPGTNSGTAYEFLLNNADYQMSSLDLGSHDEMFVRGTVRLYVTANIRIGSSGQIILATNANFTIYVAGSVDMQGGGVVNGGGYAKNLSLLGLPTCTLMDYGGSAVFVGTIYAPQALVKLRGNADFYGAVVGKDFDFRGGVAFHYDESLQGDPNKNRFVVGSWIEL